MGDSASKGSVGFLRGLLTNLGTPPVTSVIRSILVRPRIDKEARVVDPGDFHYGSYARGVKGVRRPGQRRRRARSMSRRASCVLRASRLS